MTRVIVGKWGKNLAVRIPFDVARAAGLSDGEEVEIATQDGDITIHRSAARAARRRDAEQAAAEILADGKQFSLKGLSIRELRDEGRP
jgi:antitoxin MazE